MVPRPERTKLSFSSMVDLNAPSRPGAFARHHRASHHTRAQPHRLTPKSYLSKQLSLHIFKVRIAFVYPNMLLTAGTVTWSNHEDGINE